MYTIGEAASRAGVSVELLRAWERRYRIVTPLRTPAGYRLYDEATIARVKAMRRLVADGWTPSAAANSLRDVPDEEIGAHPEPSLALTPDTDAATIVEHFVQAAGEMDTAGVQRVLDDIGSRGSFEATVDRYLFPALRALGTAWQDGTVSVAAEHAASAAAARWLGAAFDAAGSAGDSRPVLVGLPPGARHELGALAFATAARRAGMPIQYLGADLPAAEWIRAARATSAAGAVIGVPTASDAQPARAVAGALHEAIRGIPIAFGGEGARGIRGTVLPDQLRQAVADLRARLAAG